MKEIKGRFHLTYIENGKVYPAYQQGEDAPNVDDLVKMGMFGKNIGVNKEVILGIVKEEGGE